jgi:hypothetical protein
VAWAILHAADRPYETHQALAVSLVLTALGVLGTLPTLFQLFGE